MKIKALLLAAGYGTRLRPLTNSIPKCLVKIQGKPLLSYWLEMLEAAGIERVMVNTHYLPGVVEHFILNANYSVGIDLRYEAELLGTGGTLLANKEYFSSAPFLVAHADNLTKFNLGDLLNAHKNRPLGVEITMMTFITDSPSSCGIVELNEEGIVLAFHEKVQNPPSNYANAAVYIMEPSVLEFIESLGKPVIDLSTEVLPFYLGRMKCYLNQDYHRDIGTLESLEKAEKEFFV